MRRRMILAAALAAAVLGPAHLAAQTPRNLVLEQLDLGAEVPEAAGFRVAEDALPRRSVIGILPNEGTVALDLSLTEGTRYFIVGVCDGACRDLDLALLDLDDDVTLAEDVGDDDVPVLDLVAPRTGVYYLVVRMPDCQKDFCMFGYRVWREGGADVGSR